MAKLLSKKVKTEIARYLVNEHYDKVAFFQDQDGNQDYNTGTCSTDFSSDPDYIGALNYISCHAMTIGQTLEKINLIFELA